MCVSRVIDSASHKRVGGESCSGRNEEMVNGAIENEWHQDGPGLRTHGVVVLLDLCVLWLSLFMYPPPPPHGV